MLFTGVFPREWVMLHRLVFGGHYYTSCEVTDTEEGQDLNWYYLCVV